MEGQGSKLLATLLHMCFQVGFSTILLGQNSLVLQINLSTPETKTVTAVTRGGWETLGTVDPALSSKHVCPLEHLGPLIAHTLPSFSPLVPRTQGMASLTGSKARTVHTEAAESDARLSHFVGWFRKHKAFLPLWGKSLPAIWVPPEGAMLFSIFVGSSEQSPAESHSFSVSVLSTYGMPGLGYTAMS